MADERTYHHGDLKRQLIDRAVKIISEEGVEALSLRGLAKDLGVSHAAPARHFKTRSALLSAVAAYGYGELIKATRAALGASPQKPGVAHLRAMIIANITWAKDHPQLFRIMRNPDVMRHADAGLMAMLKQFTDGQLVILKAVQQNGWNKDCEPNMLRAQIAAMLTGVSMMLCDPDFDRLVDLGDKEQFIAKSVDLVLQPR